MAGTRAALFHSSRAGKEEGKSLQVSLPSPAQPSPAREPRAPRVHQPPEFCALAVEGKGRSWGRPPESLKHFDDLKYLEIAPEGGQGLPFSF